MGDRGNGGRWERAKEELMKKPLSQVMREVQGQTERAAIVKYLRFEAERWDDGTLAACANLIEDGYHHTNYGGERIEGGQDGNKG